MRVSANNITQLAEKAIVAFIVGQGPANIPVANIYGGIGANEPPLIPCVKVIAGDATPEIPFDGGWVVPVSIEVHTGARDESSDQHHVEAGEIFGYFFSDPAALALLISSQALAFSAFFVYPTGQNAPRKDGTHWISASNFDVHCCGSYIP